MLTWQLDIRLLADAGGESFRRVADERHQRIVVRARAYERMRLGAHDIGQESHCRISDDCLLTARFSSARISRTVGLRLEAEDRRHAFGVLDL